MDYSMTGAKERLRLWLRAVKEGRKKRQQKRDEEAKKIEEQLRVIGDEEVACLERELAGAREATKDARRLLMKAEKHEGTMREAVEKAKKRAELNKVKQRIEQLEAKDPELGKQSDSYPDCIAKENIKLEVEVAAMGEKPIYSPYTAIGGVPFRLSAAVTMNGGKHINICLNCNEDSANVSYLAMVLCRLLTPSTQAALVNGDPIGLCAGGNELIPLLSPSWANAMDPMQGFLRDGRFTIDIQIKLQVYYKNHFAYLSPPSSEPTDVTLIVEGIRYLVNKTFIAHFSEYFQALFFGEFAEKDKSEIELEDIDAEHFEKLFGCAVTGWEDEILPELLTSVEDVAAMVRMAEFFGVDVILTKCQKMLMQNRSFARAAILQLAEEFRHFGVQYKILNNIETTQDIFECMSSPEFEQISERLQMHILQRYIKIFNE